MTDPQHATKPKVLSTKEASQGETSGHVRTILLVSLVLAILAGIGFALYY